MLKDITLGQYYQEESPVHALDPRVKLVGTVVFMISLFLFNNFICYMLGFLFLVIMIGLSKVPVKFMLRGMKSIFFLLLLTVVYNLFLSSGDVLVSFGSIKITWQGLEGAVYMMMRLSLLIVGSSLMTLTTTPNQLTDGLESLLKPLRLFRIPVHEVAMMMSIALRFIPILMEETDKIMKAQIARGAQFESKNLFKKAKALVPLLVPLIISAFRRANDLALAMEARCYRGGDSRTKMKPLRYRIWDISGYILLIMYLLVIILCGIFLEGSLVEIYKNLTA